MICREWVGVSILGHPCGRPAKKILAFRHLPARRPLCGVHARVYPPRDGRWLEDLPIPEKESEA
jgi:hypothetical protein